MELAWAVGFKQAPGVDVPLTNDGLACKSRY